MLLVICHKRKLNSFTRVSDCRDFINEIGYNENK